MTRNRFLAALIAAALLPAATACKLLKKEEKGPTATMAGDAYATAEDTILSVPAPGVIANDTGPSLAAQMGVQAAHGNVVLSSDGSFTYTPDPDFYGTDSFKYWVTGAADGDMATVTLTVTSVPEPPTAVDDGYNSTGWNGISPAAPGVLGNDTPAEIPSGTITALLVTGPAHANSFTLNADGSFAYVAASGWTGSDTFTYRAVDGPYQSLPATVTLDTTTPNIAPVAVDDAFSTGEDVPLDFNVMVNDIDPDGPSLTATLVAGVAHGLLVLNPDGSGSFTPDADWDGVDTFTYRLSDGKLPSAIATVTITVRDFDGTMAKIYGLAPQSYTPYPRILRYPADGSAPLPIWQMTPGWNSRGFMIEPGTTYAWLLFGNGLGDYELHRVNLATQAAVKIADVALPSVPWGLDFDSTGKLYTVTGAIYEINKVSGAVTAVSPVFPADASDLAIGQNDQFYVQPLSLIPGSPWVYHWDPAVPGTVTAWSVMPAGGGLPVGAGIAADTTGNVYFTSMDTNKIWRCKDVDSSGTADAGETVIFTTLTFDPSGGGCFPYGLAVAKDAGADVLYVNVYDDFSGDPGVGVWTVTMAGVAAHFNPTFAGNDGGCLAGPR